MTTILIIVALAVATWAITAFVGRMPRASHMPLATAIMLGLSVYLFVGSPRLPGHGIAPPANEDFGQRLTDPRHGMTERFGTASQILTFSDAMIRAGRTEMAAQYLAQSIARIPGNVDLWVGYGNALVAHAGGAMTPAAAMAFDRAAAIEPGHPAPPFFAGLALAQSGDVEGARAIWQQLLDSTPAGAPWRADLQQRLAQMPPAPPAAPAAPSATSAPARPRAPAPVSGAN
jgi:cytochrome c-type biogenesis protein CcmH/NrfG